VDEARAPDLVAVGHVTLDETSRGVQPGGAAYYAAITAYRLGLQVALLTSFADDFPREVFPPGLEVAVVPAARTTRYGLTTSAGGRRLKLRARAADLGATSLPPAWREPGLAVVCPVAGEVVGRLAASFEDTAVAVLPQGWMRGFGRDGTVSQQRWPGAAAILPHVQVVVVSDEDLEGSDDDAVAWFQQVPLGALTRGEAGATLYVNGEPYHLAPDTVTVVDDTGAGDVFATTLLVEYQRCGDPWLAGAAATCAAAASTTGEGASAIPDRERLEMRVAAYLRRQGG
jgi:sugar/nucleoside kinase (ribokinase family)